MLRTDDLDLAQVRLMRSLLILDNFWSLMTGLSNFTDDYDWTLPTQSLPLKMTEWFNLSIRNYCNSGKVSCEEGEFTRKIALRWNNCVFGCKSQKTVGKCQIWTLEHVLIGYFRMCNRVNHVDVYVTSNFSIYFEKDKFPNFYFLDRIPHNEN